MKAAGFARRFSESFLIFLMVCSPAGLAQKIFFQQLTTAEGLPSDYVNTIYEDGKGFLWIGTDKGACRYDGKQFLYFTKDNGLTSNFIYCISSDPSGNIWLGTFEGGLCKYDGTKMIRYPLPDNSEFKNIFGILFSADGSFIIETGAFQLFFFKDENSAPQKLMGEGPNFISLLSKDRFLVGIPKKALYILERNGDRFTHRELWHAKSPFQWMLGSQSHGRFAVQQDGELWVYSFDLKGRLVGKKIPVDRKFNIDSEKSFYSKGKEMWIGSYNGLLYVDEKEKSHFITVGQGLPGNYVNGIFDDRQQNIYICIYGGGIRIWPRQYLKEYLLQGKVNCIYPGPKSVYISTTKGVYKYQSDKKPELLKNLLFDNYSCIYQSGQGHICLGTYTGFYRLPNEQELSRLNSSTRKKYEFVTQVGVSGFQEQPGGILYVSTFGEGLLLFDKTNKLVKLFSEKNDRLVSGLVEFLKPLKRCLGVLTNSSGIILMDSVNQTQVLAKKEGLLSNAVYSVFQEENGKLWIGTLNGLNLFEGNRIIRTFSYREGFIGTKVLCIFRDKEKRFWVLSDKCLHLLEGNRLRALGSHPLLFDDKNSINRAEYDTASGSLYLGLTDALLVVDLQKIVPDTVVRLPFLASVFTADSLALDPLINRHLLLYSDKIQFHFANRYYPQDQKLETYYKLTGYDEDWKLLDNRTGLSYQKLASGKFELLAKTINPDGYSSPAVSLFQFEILPPVWKRGWFVLLAAALLVCLLFYVVDQYNRSRYERKIKRIHEVYRLQLERERIARELHDNVGSQLTYLINKIEDDHALLADKAEADKLSDFARGAMRDLRETIWALDKEEVLLEELVNKLKGLTSLYKSEKQQIELEWKNGILAPDSHGDVVHSLEALNIFRIVQEALNNAVKYSRGSFIKIGIHQLSQSLQISIQDNGQGFKVLEAEKGYGLRNMRKRAEEMNAVLKFESRMGEGTYIDLTVPISQPFS